MIKKNMTTFFSIGNSLGDDLNTFFTDVNHPLPFFPISDYTDDQLHVGQSIKFSAPKKKKTRTA
jgi:hypothetical protein